MKRQGELLFIKVEEFPDDDGNWTTQKPEGNHLIIGHSETGHHHVIDRRKCKTAELIINEMREFETRLLLGEDAEVEHLRSFDTHKTLKLPAGKYVVRHRREYTPKGLRRVQD